MLCLVSLLPSKVVATLDTKRKERELGRNAILAWRLEGVEFIIILSSLHCTSHAWIQLEPKLKEYMYKSCINHLTQIDNKIRVLHSTTIRDGLASVA